jgi:large subunit ribosomal protein L19
MSSQLLRTLTAKTSKKKIPEIKPGNTVRVHERVKEGDKERIQMFEGLVIAVHKGHIATDRTITVRKIVSGVGVEKIFPLHSPSVERFEVRKEAKVRRARLSFLRGRRGKAARMNERFLGEDDFAQAVSEPVAEAPAADAPAAEAPKAEKTDAK